MADLDIFIKSRLGLINFGNGNLTVYDYNPDRDQKETVFPNATLYRVDYSIRDADIRTDHDYFYADSIVVDASNGIPIKIKTKRRITVIEDGSMVRISGVRGNTAANGDWVAKNVSTVDNSFDIYYLDGITKSIANDFYTGGGIVLVSLPGADGSFGTPVFIRKPFPSPVDVYYEVTLSSTKKSHVDSLNELIHQVFPPGYQAKVPGCIGVATFILLQHFIRDDRTKPLYRSVYQYAVDGLWLERLERYIHAPIVDIDLGVEF